LLLPSLSPKASNSRTNPSRISLSIPPSIYSCSSVPWWWGRGRNQIQELLRMLTYMDKQVPSLRGPSICLSPTHSPLHALNHLWTTYDAWCYVNATYIVAILNYLGNHGKKIFCTYCIHQRPN
jgi:hypothetical protein